MDGSTKQREGLRRSRNWPQVGYTGPEESLRWSLVFRFWSYYALLWCIMSDLRSYGGVGYAYLVRVMVRIRVRVRVRVRVLK